MYNYIPLPITDGPIKDLKKLVIIMARALIDRGIDINNTWVISEADRGGGILLGAFQVLTGCNIHWLNWYDKTTMDKFKESFIAEEMDPAFMMGAKLIPGLYLPEYLKSELQEKGVVIIDDVISTGKTIFTIKKILDMAEIPLKAIISAVEKTDYKGADNLREKFPHIPVITIAKIKIRKLKEKSSYIIGETESIENENISYYLT
jgi:hypothetical protein